MVCTCSDSKRMKNDRWSRIQWLQEAFSPGWRACTTEIRVWSRKCSEGEQGFYGGTKNNSDTIIALFCISVIELPTHRLYISSSVLPPSLTLNLSVWLYVCLFVCTLWTSLCLCAWVDHTLTYKGRAQKQCQVYPMQQKCLISTQ